MANGDDPRTRDYAIIIGVTKYPRLRLGGQADLAGPINDAKKVRAWIESPQGGGVPPGNIQYVVRAATTDSIADPTRDAVVDAFVALYALCYPNGPEGPPVEAELGRRLYVYVSGHGLAADLDHGALLCSNSSPNLFATVPPYASIKAFRQGGFFREFVIWFDGCMDWAGLESEPINYIPRPRGGLRDSEPPGPVFTAYAARPRLKTVEAPDSNGEIHGVFTRTLLEGLEGGAADPDTGLVDSLSLQKYLFNNMPKYLPDSAKNDPLVDKQPFVRTDPGIVFGTKNVTVPSRVVLRFDAAYEGADARVWGRAGSEQSLSLLAQKKIVNGEVQLALGNGAYAVDVPQHGLRTGFEVTGNTVTKLSPN